MAASIVQFSSPRACGHEPARVPARVAPAIFGRPAAMIDAQVGRTWSNRDRHPNATRRDRGAQIGIALAGAGFGRIIRLAVRSGNRSPRTGTLRRRPASRCPATRHRPIAGWSAPDARPVATRRRSGLRRGAASSSRAAHVSPRFLGGCLLPRAAIARRGRRPTRRRAAEYWQAWQKKRSTLLRPVVAARFGMAKRKLHVHIAPGLRVDPFQQLPNSTALHVAPASWRTQVRHCAAG